MPTHPVRVSGMRLSHCTLPGEPWHCPSSPWRAGRAADGTYCTYQPRRCRLDRRPKGTYLSSPALPPHSSSCCADLPCSNAEPGCTPDSSIHKTLPRPPSFFDCLITWPSHLSRPNQQNLQSSNEQQTIYNKTNPRLDKAASTTSAPHRPLSSSTYRCRPPRTESTGRGPI